MITEPGLACCLRQYWGLAHVRITVHNGGMGSATWFVDHGALGGLDAADPDSMPWGLLHADPAPGAFRLNPATRRCGIIDWSYALRALVDQDSGMSSQE